LKVKIKSDGQVEVEKKGWNVEKLKLIVIEFYGQLTSRYRYPINPEDKIEEIVIRVEEG